MKYLMLIVLCLSLTGCVKYNINITVNEDKTMDASMVMKVQNSFLEAYGYTAEEFMEESLSDIDVEDATVEQSTETIDGEEWSCVTISGLSSTDVSSGITEEEVDGKNSLVLTIPTSDFATDSTVDLSAYGYTVSQLKALGIEMTISVTMPNTVTSNVGEVNGNTVTIDLLELMYGDTEMPDNIIISSPISSGSNMTMIIVGVVAVVAVAAGVYVFMNRKKKDPVDDFDTME